MKLEELIQKRFTEREGLTKFLVKFGDYPARAIAAASNDKELSEEEFHQLTALIKGAVRPGTRKLTPDEAKLWAEVGRINTRLKQEMVAASFTVRALPGDLQEDAINILSKTVSGMMGDLSRLMAETGEP